MFCEGIFCHIILSLVIYIFISDKSQFQSQTRTEFLWTLMHPHFKTSLVWMAVPLVKAFGLSMVSKNFFTKQNRILTCWRGYIKMVLYFFCIYSALTLLAILTSLIRSKIFFILLLFTKIRVTDVFSYFRVYKQNIRIADEIVKQTEKLINEFYNDDQSVFLFTSDHGMTDWGNFLFIFS